jgi:hypothetical protein
MEDREGGEAQGVTAPPPKKIEGEKSWYYVLKHFVDWFRISEPGTFH